MKLNKRGISLVEVIVTIALISIVLIFLINLFVNVRGTYNNGKIESDYEMLKATIIKAIGEDIENYGLVSVDSTGTNEVTFIFNSTRETDLTENIKKVLTVYQNDSNYYISYLHVYDSDLTTEERTETVIRKVPDDAIVGDIDGNKLIVNKGNGIVEVKIPIYSGGDVDYSINIYGLLE